MMVAENQTLHTSLQWTEMLRVSPRTTLVTLTAEKCSSPQSPAENVSAWLKDVYNLCHLFLIV
jgi:hypothetical protein